jgi:pSer/pThr/pTyr-binding forkhead associated (FHA) protein
MIDLEQKLRLYQVFSKLYEHNPNLLNEILQLENTTSQRPAQASTQYVTGVVEGDSVYLIANLTNATSQKIYQSQGIWVLGRSCQASIEVMDERVSRHHAAIEYRHREGFYLSDLDSTNGTFVNHEFVTEPVLLRDGDRVRLGTVVFSFFCCQELRQSDPVAPEILARLQHISERQQPTVRELQEKTTYIFLSQPTSLASFEDTTTPLPTAKLTPDRQAEILDRFFKNERSSDSA